MIVVVDHIVEQELVEDRNLELEPDTNNRCLVPSMMIVVANSLMKVL